VVGFVVVAAVGALLFVVRWKMGQGRRRRTVASFADHHDMSSGNKVLPASPPPSYEADSLPGGLGGNSKVMDDVEGGLGNWRGEEMGVGMMPPLKVLRFDESEGRHQDSVLYETWGKVDFESGRRGMEEIVVVDQQDCEVEKEEERKNGNAVGMEWQGVNSDISMEVKGLGESMEEESVREETLQRDSDSVLLPAAPVLSRLHVFRFGSVGCRMSYVSTSTSSSSITRTSRKSLKM
jgi:hypothetical protein